LRYLKWDNFSKIKKIDENHMEVTFSVEYRFPDGSRQTIIQVFSPRFKITQRAKKCAKKCAKNVQKMCKKMCEQ